MRLLQETSDGAFRLVEFFGKNIPPYAILSHTWGPDEEEITYKDIMKKKWKSKAGYKKLRFCADQAARERLQYFWIDTCCINKSSSAELSEAINSMFRWYRKAAACYVYLSDVAVPAEGVPDLMLMLERSRWFTRGWTLQELLAPRPTAVAFFDAHGTILGDKRSLVKIIHTITGIHVEALEGRPLSEFSVEDRMSWAENRQTTREEDAAYSLLGIFDIHMPLIYGEGRKKALARLQREIRDSLMADTATTAKTEHERIVEEYERNTLLKNPFMTGASTNAKTEHERIVEEYERNALDVAKEKSKREDLLSKLRFEEEELKKEGKEEYERLSQGQRAMEVEEKAKREKLEKELEKERANIGHVLLSKPRRPRPEPKWESESESDTEGNHGATAAGVWDSSSEAVRDNSIRALFRPTSSRTKGKIKGDLARVDNHTYNRHDQNDPKNDIPQVNLTSCIEELEERLQAVGIEERRWKEQALKWEREATKKITYNSFQRGDIVLFQPMRNQRSLWLEAYNFGAEYYFYHVPPSQMSTLRGDFIARITKIEQQFLSAPWRPWSEDGDPFEIPSGTRCFLLDVAEVEPNVHSEDPETGRVKVMGPSDPESERSYARKPTIGRHATYIY